MARVIMEGLTLKQAKMFAEWYEGQGEQDAYEWFDLNGLRAPMTNVHHKGGYMKVDGEDVIIYCEEENA